jgi:hypothetical protein
VDDVRGLVDLVLYELIGVKQILILNYKNINASSLNNGEASAARTMVSIFLMVTPLLLI